MNEEPGPVPRGPAAMASRVIVALRWFVVAGWIAGAVIATIMLPGLGGSSDLELPLPSDAAPLKAEARSAEIFGSPLLTRTQVVVSRQGGLSAPEQRDLAEFALRVSQHKVVGLTDIQAAVPLTSAGGVAPGAEPGPASVITYLAFGPGTSVAHQTRVARDYAAVAPVPQGARADLTGTYPAQQEQMETIDDKLPLVVGVTLALIVLVVALVFRSIVAPLVVLGTIGVAYAIDLRAIGAVGEAIGITATRDIEPVVSALLMGIVTDYAIFYLFGVRNRLRSGDARSAAIGAGAQMTAIVITAGLCTALGTAVLLVGDVDFFRAFAPALALTAVTGVLVSVTLLPALLAILGRATFWPGGVPAEERGPRHRVSRPPLGMRLLTNRAVAAVSVLVLIGALVMAALPLRNLELGLGLTSRLAPEARGATGFAPGVTAPTEILVEGPGATDPAFLKRFEDGLSGPGVADVLGPADPLPQLAPSVFISQQAGASRFVVVFDAPPTEHRAIQDYRALEDRLPGLVSSAGAPDAQVGVSGDTAIASASVDAMQTELLRVGSAALVINFLLLAAFLRALVAPLYLLVANALTVAATLGITTWFFQDHLGEGQLVYYVPFATAVLLLALGSDYNIYLVGGIWRAGRRLGLVEGIRTAMPAASVSISVAGLILAGSFGLLALVPIDALRQFAFVMALGVGLDTFVVRPFLVPSLITLFGRTGFWPGRPAPEPDAEEAIPPRDPSAPASAPAGPR